MYNVPFLQELLILLKWMLGYFCNDSCPCFGELLKLTFLTDDFTISLDSRCKECYGVIQCIMNKFKRSETCFPKVSARSFMYDKCLYYTRREPIYWLFRLISPFSNQGYVTCKGGLLYKKSVQQLHEVLKQFDSSVMPSFLSSKESTSDN